MFNGPFADRPRLFAERRKRIFAVGSVAKKRGTSKTLRDYVPLDIGKFCNAGTEILGKDGKIQAIDKAVKPATSAEDMAAKLGELQTDPAK